MTITPSIDKNWLATLLPPNPTILDIGSYDGKDAQELSTACGDCFVHCFEPSLHGFAKLQALEDKRLFLWKYAVSNYKGVVTLNVAPDHQQSNTITTPTRHLKQFPNVRYNGTERVNVTRLDDWNLSVRQNKPIDLIWCDVNGSEGNFIAGAASTLARTKYLYIEFCVERLFAKSLNRYQILTALPGFELMGEYSVGENYGNMLLRNKSLIV